MKFKLYSPQGIRECDFEIFAEDIKTISFYKEKPFSDHRLEIISKLSKKFLKSELGSEYPQIVVLGFWLRSASVKSFISDFLSNTPNQCMPFPKGMAFHLPPQNVDTMFVYSWAISFLVGNANIVRLPSQLNPLSEWIIKEIVNILEDNNEGNKNFFCNYPLDSQFSDSLSLACDVRIIWGGDQKIKNISKAPLKPTASNINFPDRQSFCIIDSLSYEASDENTKQSIAEKLFNDIFWFDQMGCSSPKAIVFLGKINKKIDFYNRLVEVAEIKEKLPQSSTVISKFVNANEISGKGISKNSYSIKNILDISETNLSKDVFEYFHGGGSIFHFEIKNLDQISALLSDKTQTLTYFGLREEDKKKIVEIMSQYGGFRLVNIGDALSFDTVWDGIDIFSGMSKLIKVE
jgi:hypothetical protein